MSSPTPTPAPAHAPALRTTISSQNELNVNDALSTVPYHPRRPPNTTTPLVPITALLPHLQTRSNQLQTQPSGAHVRAPTLHTVQQMPRYTQIRQRNAENAGSYTLGNETTEPEGVRWGSKVAAVMGVVAVAAAVYCVSSGGMAGEAAGEKGDEGSVRHEPECVVQGEVEGHRDAVSAGEHSRVGSAGEVEVAQQHLPPQVEAKMETLPLDGTRDPPNLIRHPAVEPASKIPEAHHEPATPVQSVSYVEAPLKPEPAPADRVPAAPQIPPARIWHPAPDGRDVYTTRHMVGGRWPFARTVVHRWDGYEKRYNTCVVGGR